MKAPTDDQRRPISEFRFKIHDLVATRLEPVERPSGIHWPALRFNDHLLRRFGAAEIVRITSNSLSQLHRREAADEVWALVEGRVEFVWHDQRQDSPTCDEHDRLSCDSPTRVLVPFGVAFAVRTLDAPSWLLRFSTHEDGEHAADRWVGEPPVVE